VSRKVVLKVAALGSAVVAEAGAMEETLAREVTEAVVFLASDAPGHRQSSPTG
jgi:hypothetical protein